MSFEEGACTEHMVSLVRDDSSTTLLRSFRPCSRCRAPSKCPGLLHGWAVLWTPTLGHVPPGGSQSSQGRSSPKLLTHPCVLINWHVRLCMWACVCVCVKLPLPSTVHNRQQINKYLWMDKRLGWCVCGGLSEPPMHPGPNSQNVWMSPHICRGDEGKSLETDHHLGLSRWAPCHPSILMEGRWDITVRCSHVLMETRGPGDVRKGSQAKVCRWPVESPLGVSRRHTALPTACF